MPKLKQIKPQEPEQPDQPDQVVQKPDEGSGGGSPDFMKKMAANMNEGFANMTAQNEAPAKQDTPSQTPPEAPSAPAKPSSEAPAAEGGAEGAAPTEPAKAPEDEPVPAIIKSPKAADEFRKLRSSLRQQIEERQQEILGLKEKLSKEKAEVERVRTKPDEFTQEMEQLRKERDDLMERLEVVSLERSPSFQSKYQKRFDSATEQAKAAAGEHAEAAVAVMKMPPSPQRKAMLGEIFDQLDHTDQVMLGVAVSEMDAARRDKDIELANHRETLQQQEEVSVAEQQRQQQVAEAKAEFMVQEVLKAAGQFEAFQEREGDQEHNGRVNEYKQEVELILKGKAPDAAVAFLPVMAAEGQYLRDHKLPAMEAKIKELEARLAKITGVSPSPGDAPSSSDADRKDGKPKGFMDAFRENYEGIPLHGI